MESAGKLRDAIQVANSPSRRGAPYRILVAGVFSLACGLFLLVELVWFGAVATGGPSWGLWFVCFGFLTLAVICLVGAAATWTESK